MVVGEPRAGRSDLVEALRRVLDPDSTRTPLAEFDVYLGGGAGDSSGEDAESADADADGEEEPADNGDIEIAQTATMVSAGGSTFRTVTSTPGDGGGERST